LLRALSKLNSNSTQDPWGAAEQSAAPHVFFCLVFRLRLIIVPAPRRVSVVKIPLMKLLERISRLISRIDRSAASVAMLIAIIVAIPAGSAQTHSAGSVDSYIAAQLREQHIPGLALAVVQDGRVVKSRGYGLANIELGVPVTPETVFQLGSIGKQFTATGVLMLAEDGKLSLDDKITQYLPSAAPGWNGVTIRHLLNHTSGLADYTDDKYIAPGGLTPLHEELTDQEILCRFTRLPFDFKPGEKWSYSNTGYAILGFLIRKVSGQSYGDFLEARIFKPLGMSATRVISESAIIPNRAAGYILEKNEIKNQHWVSPHWNTLADGALYSTVADMTKWDASITAHSLLSPESDAQMWTPARLNNGTSYPYGFAWDLLEVNGHRVQEHGGAWQGFTAHYSRYPDDHLSVIVLTNLESGPSNPEKIAHEVAAIYIPALKPQSK
jgi:CubicO group peptidase (beta-lactamase class C family)